MNIFRSIGEKLHPFLTKNFGNLGSKLNSFWSKFVNGKFVSSFRQKLSGKTSKVLAPFKTKAGRQAFAHKIRHVWIPGVLLWAKKHKKGLLIGAGVTAVGAFVLWLLSQRKDDETSDESSADIPASQRIEIEQAASKLLVDIDNLTDRAKKIDYVKLGSLVARIVRTAEDGGNVRESEVVFVLDQIAVIGAALAYCSDGATEYLNTQQGLLANGYEFDPDYSHHNYRQVQRVGIRDILATREAQSLVDVIDKTEDLVIGPIRQIY